METSKPIDESVVKNAAKQFDQLVQAGLIPNFNNIILSAEREDNPQCKLTTATQKS